MRTMAKYSANDGMSQLLYRMTVTSTVYCLSDFGAPWGFRVSARLSPAFHLVTAGTAWLQVDGRPGGDHLQAGDLVVLPRGDAHEVRDCPGSRVTWLDEILEEAPPVDGRLEYGGEGLRTELVCGGFGIDQLTARPILDTLPQVIHVRGHDGHAPEWLSGLVRMISVEMAANRPGAEAVVSRLTDALLAQALRHHMLRHPHLAASPARDPQVARALTLMREKPDEGWSVATLAARVGLSRSAFAQRFRAATGETPIQNLTRYRLAQAANYLAKTDAAIEEIALRTGYDSQVSISRAFKRQYGTSPGAYRKAAQQTAG